ncbi:MAG: 2-oxoacid:ferredoxin oxidoreductase subunit beta [bacterium]
MKREKTPLIHKYLRTDKKFPHIWCPGCGNGIVLGAMIRAIDRSEYSKDDIALVSGIGCSGRIATYVDFNTLHTTHGRALTFATGIKLANPKLQIIVVMGDGDATAIGGNHFIHAARRNINLTVIVINNSIYGMTGGQYSPATPYGMKAKTAPYQNIEHAFDISQLGIASGASFVGRATAYQARLIERLIYQGLFKDGFALIEVISHCHTQYGRMNQLGDHIEMMKRQKESSVDVGKVEKMPKEELEGKIVTGVLADREMPVYFLEMEKIRKKAGWEEK